jgi:hypothetical protein
MASTDWNIGHSGLSSSISPLGRTAGTAFPALSSIGAQGDSYNDQMVLGQIQPSILSDAQVGLSSKLTPAGRNNNIVPSGQGQAYAEFSATASPKDVPDIVTTSGRTANIGSITGIVEITYYKMQGYYVAGAIYETWVGIGSPNTNPPSGHTLTNIVVVSTFTH